MTSRTSLAAIFAALAAALAACSSGAVGSLKDSQRVDPATSGALEFAVGTATFPNGIFGLNLVETYRQGSGLAASLYNVPTITGPASFINPLGNLDRGTNRITQDTLGAATGAFGSGFCACNSLTGTIGSTGNVAPPAIFVPFSLPFGATGAINAPPTMPPAVIGQAFAGGAPAFPSVFGAGYPVGFVGFPLGFTTVLANPVPGKYTLDIGLPPTFLSAAHATATLTANPLPEYPAPVFIPDEVGGGRFRIAPPAGVSESLIAIKVSSACLGASPPTAPPVGGQTQPDATTYYLTLVTKTTGPQEIGLPDNLGPLVNGKSTVTLCSRRSTLTFEAIGFDYPAYERTYPNDYSQTPKLVGSAGTVDVTTSALTQEVYP